MCINRCEGGRYPPVCVYEVCIPLLLSYICCVSCHWETVYEGFGRGEDWEWVGLWGGSALGHRILADLPRC